MFKVISVVILVPILFVLLCWLFLHLMWSVKLGRDDYFPKKDEADRDRIDPASQPEGSGETAARPSDFTKELGKLRPEVLDSVIRSRLQRRALRSRAFTALTRLKSDVAEPILLSLLDAKDGYVRVKVLGFGLRKGFKPHKFPKLAAQIAHGIETVLQEKSRQVAHKTTLVGLLTRYDDSSYEPSIIPLLKTRSVRLRQEVLEYLERHGTMAAIDALNDAKAPRSFFSLGAPKTTVDRVIEEIRARQVDRVGGLSVIGVSDAEGGLSAAEAPAKSEQ